MKMNNIRKITKKYQIFLLSIILIFSLTSSNILLAEETQHWEVRINGLVELDNVTDWVIFGEDINSTDGPPEDYYDILKPPTSPTPYVYMYFYDGMPNPYTFLHGDFRLYPDTNKIWNLTLSWSSNYVGTSIVNLTWDTSNLTLCEYQYVNLTYAVNGAFCVDMLTNNNFSFTMTSINPGAPVFETFKIICEGERSVSDDDDDSGGSSGGGGGVPPPPNQPPVAKISVSDTSGFIGETINFDGSSSTDDGTITNYSWDFNDGTIAYGVKTSHVFSKIGTYQVTLIVTDDNAATDEETIDIIITIANSPPTEPIVDGPSTGHKNILYNFTTVSTDAENETIKYSFFWGDGESNTTDFLLNGTEIIQIHSWESYGIYEIQVFAEDASNSRSANATLTLYIDVYPINDVIVGYFIDENSDEIYDRFFNEATDFETDLKKQNDSSYLIDSDGDGDWDYIYDFDTWLTRYKSKNEGETPGFELLSVILVIGLALIFLRKWK